MFKTSVFSNKDSFACYTMCMCTYNFRVTLYKGLLLSFQHADGLEVCFISVYSLHTFHCFSLLVASKFVHKLMLPLPSFTDIQLVLLYLHSVHLLHNDVQYYQPFRPCILNPIFLILN
jgi:hypothetical protein